MPTDNRETQKTPSIAEVRAHMAYAHKLRAQAFADAFSWIGAQFKRPRATRKGLGAIDGRLKRTHGARSR